MNTQLITPNPDIPCRPGYCLEYVRETFDLPIRYGSAMEAWQNSPTQHLDLDFPDGLDVPVWFAIDGIPDGHVALRMGDGTVYSASDLGSTPHHHTSVAELIAYYLRWGKLTLTYLGWSEDVAGYPVVSLDTPPPPPPTDWFDMATPDDLKTALREVMMEPDVIDAYALGLLHRTCECIDPSGLTTDPAPQGTTLANKIHWMAHNDAQQLRAITALHPLLALLDGAPVPTSQVTAAAPAVPSAPAPAVPTAN